MELDPAEADDSQQAPAFTEAGSEPIERGHFTPDLLWSDLDSSPQFCTDLVFLCQVRNG